MPTSAQDGAVVQRILSGRNFVLERIARGDPLADVLESLATTSEAAIPEMLCSILILDEPP